MECREVKNLLSDYVDGVVSESLAPVVKQHLTTCSDCRDTYHAMNRLVGAMREMEPVEEPAGFVTAVRAKLETRPSLADRLRGLVSPPLVKVPLGVAAALVVAVVITQLPRPEHPAGDRIAATGVPEGPGREKSGAATRQELAKKSGTEDKIAGGPAEESPAQPPPPVASADRERDKEETSWGGTTVRERAEEQSAGEGSGSAQPGPQARPPREEPEIAAPATIDVGDLLDVATLPADSVPEPADTATAVPAGPPPPISAGVASVGGVVIGTELGEAGERVALIARVPADSLQSLYRVFGRENVTAAGALARGARAPGAESEVRMLGTSETLRTRRDSAATPPAATDSVVVRIRLES